MEDKGNIYNKTADITTCMQDKATVIEIMQAVTEKKDQDTPMDIADNVTGGTRELLLIPPIL